MSEGLADINIGNMEDWGLFALAPTLSGTAAFQGTIETKGVPRRPVSLRPAYHALKLVANKLGEFTSVKRIDLGRGIYAFSSVQKPIAGCVLVRLWQAVSARRTGAQT